jgi:hypothetical protein
MPLKNRKRLPWMKLYLIGGRSKRALVGLTDDEAARLASYSLQETIKYGTPISQSDILRTNLNNDPGFQAITLPEKESHGSSQTKDNN